MVQYSFTDLSLVIFYVSDLGYSTLLLICLSHYLSRLVLTTQLILFTKMVIDNQVTDP